MEMIWRDLSYTFRTLRNSPWFTAVVVLILALGIGANTAIFSVVNAVLLQPLPYADPDRLMMLPATHKPNDMGIEVATANFLDWRRENRSFEKLGAYASASLNLTGGETPERVEAAVVTPDVLAALGVEPMLGRIFHPDEEKEDSRLAILSYGLWRSHFGGDPKVVGKVIRLAGTEYPIIGVMPRDFSFPTKEARLWIPFRITEARATQREERWLYVMGRLKEDVSVQAAQQEMDGLLAGLVEQYPLNKDWGVRLLPMQEHFVGKVRPALLILLTTVILVLILACANIATLQLARAATRRMEMAVRSAMGASAPVILRQLFLEGLTLALAGSLLGLLLAQWGLRLLTSLGPQYIPRVEEVGIDGKVLLFTLGIALLTGVIFALIPVLSALKPDLVGDLREGKTGASAGASQLRFRRLLTVIEVAAALVLLISANLLLSSLTRLKKIDPGFNPKDVLTLEVVLPLSKYPEQAQRATFFRLLTERAASVAGVEAVGGVSNLPLSGSNATTSYIVLDHPPEDPSKLPEAGYRGVTPGYIGAMQIPIVQGRDFSWRDTAEAQKVIIVNKTFADLHWPGENPLGKQMYIMGMGGGEIAHEVIGIVGNIHHTKLDVPTVPEIYVTTEQHAPWDNMVLVVRSRAEMMGLSPQLRAHVAALDPEQPASNIRTLESVHLDSMSEPRFYTIVLSAFAVLALVLSALGIYSIISYSVAQRRHELGVRVALGAQRGNVMKLVIWEGILVTSMGILAGLIVAWLATRGLASLLFGIQPNDPVTFAVTAVSLGIVALVASFFPALRASRVNPMIAFRT